MKGGKRERYRRDEGRDESLKTPLNKGLLIKNGRDDEKKQAASSAAHKKRLRLHNLFLETKRKLFHKTKTFEERTDFSLGKMGL